MTNYLITIGVLIAIFYGAYIGNLLSGMAKNLFIKTKTFSWTALWQGVVKWLIIGLTTVEIATVIYAAGWFAEQAGIDWGEYVQAFDKGGLIAIVAAGVAIQVGSAISNLSELYRAGKEGNLGITADSDKVEVIGEIVSEFIGSMVQHDSTVVEAGEVIETPAAETPELGSNPYYNLAVSTPSAFYNAANGKGFNEGWGYQCVAGFKEFCYSLCGRYVAAGGAAADYANNPARDAVCALGFTWHEGTAGLQDGDWAIWTNGTYGHVAMRYQGKWFGQNQGAANPNVGNAFNLMALSNAGIAGYFRPNIYAKQAEPEPAPAPTPAPAPADNSVSYTYKAGDTFGQVITDLGLKTSHGLWGADGDVAYYTEQLHQQGIWGNIPVGTTIKLTPRK